MAGQTIHFVLPEPERFSPASGGAIATVTREIAAELVALDRPVVVVTPKDASPPYSLGRVIQLRSCGTPAHELERFARGALGRLSPARWSPRARYLREVGTVLRRLEAQQVVVANDPHLAHMLARDLVSATIVLWLHNFLAPHEGAELPSLPDNVRLVTVSEAVKSWTAQAYGLDPHRITVVPNGVNPSLFYPPAGELRPHDPVRIVCHGRIDPNKGQLLAAEAVAALHQRGLRNVTLTILGAPQTFGMADEVVADYVSRLREAMSRAGGTFSGRVPAEQVGGILREHDIACLLPTVPDPFPLTGLEAMACGCAVIALPLGGVEEMIGDAALRVQPDAESVADALGRLIEDPSLLVEYRKRAAERSGQFRWSSAAMALLGLFQIQP